MNNDNSPSWLERPIHPAIPAITNEIALFAGIILLAIVTRFYNLDARVMSHDESLHTYFSWLLYRGQGYQHTPMMHGPWQFHWIALSYFLFGVSDFTARIPAAMFSIAAVGMVWYWRRYLGKTGALIAALLMVISPFMLFYGRYVREDVYTGLSGLLMLYSILRYLESGSSKYLFLLSGALIIHFADKETSFIYALQAFAFLAVYFIIQITKKPWENNPGLFRTMIIGLVVAALLIGTGAALSYINRTSQTLSGTQTAVPAVPSDAASAVAPKSSGIHPSTILLGLEALILLIIGVTYFVQAYLWHKIPKERSFDLMILIGTFVLPMTTAFPVDWLKTRLNVTIPTDSASVNALDTHSMLVIGIFVAVFLLVSVIVGTLWNRNWWKYAVLFWGVYTILFTTFFTNAAGFFTGIVGSLGYWLVQQGVERGSQPEYYYVLVQIPMYEYLPAIGSLLAIDLGVRKLLSQRPAPADPELETGLTSETDISEPISEPFSERMVDSTESNPNVGVFFALMVWWALSAILSLTIAGERMPWLTYHMAWPMILLTGWAVGQIIESLSVQLAEEKPGRILVSILVLAVFILAVFNAVRSIYGATPPFQGTDLLQLQATSAFILPLICAILSAVLLAYLMRNDLSSLAIVAFFILALMTLSSSIINGAALMNYSTTPGVDASILNSSWLKFGAALVALIGGVIAILYVSGLPRKSPFVSMVMLTAFGLLLLQTMRTSFRANYILYDDAMEFLVYAHGATPIKEVMAQVRDISERTTGGLNAIIAYD